MLPKVNIFINFQETAQENEMMQYTAFITKTTF